MISEKAGKNSGPVQVSVIILTYNEEKNIGHCLDAVFAQKFPEHFEVIVADSGSTDRTREIVKAYPVRLLEVSRDQFGHGRTRQMASGQARGRFLVYLVADAIPADEHWLSSLVEPLTEDKEFAGSYSRQIPRPNAHPVEAARLKERTAGRGEKIVRQLTDKNFPRSLKPLERLAFCDFDDVSACRRGSVLENIPIPDVPWAEDLYWSKQVLEAGYKIAFEPRSTVIHSHSRGLIHGFRRGWLDQHVAAELFGHIYFADILDLFKKYFSLLASRWKIIAQASTGPVRKIAYLFTQPGELLFEVLGNYLASRKPRREAVVHDFLKRLGRARLDPADARDRVMRTWFVLSAEQRPVLFANPDSAVIYRARIPEKAFLLFGAGINPDAWPMRRDPVRFAVEISGKRVWERDVWPESPENFSWQEVELDLAERAGEMVELSFITEAENTDHAWAGWAGPRIAIKKLRLRDRLYNRLLEQLNRVISGRPLRHP